MDTERKVIRPTSLDIATTTVVIDLCTPEVTWSESAKRRLAILALYPSRESDEQRCPLLTNIPGDRSATVFRRAFEIMDRDVTVPSFLREKQQLFFGDLLERLKVDMALLDYNYTRLNKFIRMLTDDQMRVHNLRPHETQWIEEKEYPLALEFYLQFDRKSSGCMMVVDVSLCLVNMFYMKTCSFRFARPRTMNEGLFALQVPEARYELAACGNCALCYPRYSKKYRLKKSVVDFSQAHKHTFVNGYEAILNCSAVISSDEHGLDHFCIE
jgi:hypothetical protein